MSTTCTCTWYSTVKTLSKFSPGSRTINKLMCFPSLDMGNAGWVPLVQYICAMTYLLFSDEVLVLNARQYYACSSHTVSIVTCVVYVTANCLAFSLVQGMELVNMYCMQNDFPCSFFYYLSKRNGRRDFPRVTACT